MERKEKIRSRVLMTLAAAAMMILLMGVPSMAAGVLDVEMTANGQGAYVYTGMMPDYNTTVYHKITVNKS